MAKKGWGQGLDNGVMNKPSKSGNNIQGDTKKNFYNAIAAGENDQGQITHAPGQVVRGGECIYDQQNYPRDLQGGSRWNKPKDKY